MQVIEQYPIYKKDAAHIYKLISKSLMIQVFNISYNDSCLIQYLDNDIIANRLIDECSEAEFLSAYYEVRKKLDNLSLIQL